MSEVPGSSCAEYDNMIHTNRATYKEHTPGNLPHRLAGLARLHRCRHDVLGHLRLPHLLHEYPIHEFLANDRHSANRTRGIELHSEGHSDPPLRLQLAPPASPLVHREPAALRASRSYPIKVRREAIPYNLKHLSTPRHHIP